LNEINKTSDGFSLNLIPSPQKSPENKVKVDNKVVVNNINLIKDDNNHHHGVKNNTDNNNININNTNNSILRKLDFDNIGDEDAVIHKKDSNSGSNNKVLNNKADKTDVLSINSDEGIQNEETKESEKREEEKESQMHKSDKLPQSLIDNLLSMDDD